MPAPHTPLTQQLAELRRELATRQRVYPDWVRAHRLTQSTADHRLQTLTDTVALLEHLEQLLLSAIPSATPTQGQLFDPAQVRAQPTRGLYADH